MNPAVTDHMTDHATDRTTSALTGHPAPPGQETVAEPSATSSWLAAAPHMPALTGAAGTAERLLLLVHYGVDWADGWVGRHRATYWDRLLPDRVITATYRAGSLRRWWREVAAELESTPRSAGERRELEQLLRADPDPVLEVLRVETEALLLRTRIVAEAVRATRPTPAPARRPTRASAPTPARKPEDDHHSMRSTA